MKAPEVEKRSKKERERGAKKETERVRGSFCSGYETTRTSREIAFAQVVSRGTSRQN